MTAPSLREAAQQIIDALAKFGPGSESWEPWENGYGEEVGKGLDDALAVMTAALALRDAEPVAVPAGCKLVPLEPTEEMIQAGCLSQQAKPGHENYADWFDNHSGGISERIRGYVRKDYRAMLAAHVPETNFGNMAAPVERKPLTDAEITSLAYDCGALPECEPTDKEIKVFVRAIEQAHNIQGAA